MSIQHRIPADYPKRQYLPIGAWLAEALCRHGNSDTRWWYPVRRGNEYAQRAIQVCQRCPVREDCLEHALAAEESHGIWGGMTETERAREARRREREAAQKRL